MNSGQCGGGGGDIGPILPIHNRRGVAIEGGGGVKVFLSYGAQGGGGGDDTVNSGIAAQNKRRGYVRAEKIILEDIGISAEGDAL